jgi:hypothetical protein
MSIKKTNRTMIAAEVLSTKALSGLSAQRYIWTGKTVDGSVNPLGTSTIKATIPIISKGAVSPKALAIPMIVPVNMPGRARGST